MFPFSGRPHSPNNNSQFTFLYPHSNNNYLPSNFPWERQTEAVQNVTSLRTNTSAENHTNMSDTSASLQFGSTNRGTTLSSDQHGQQSGNSMSLNFRGNVFTHENGVTTFSDVNSDDGNGTFVFHGQDSGISCIASLQNDSSTILSAKRQRSMETLSEHNGFISQDCEVQTHDHRNTWNQQNYFINVENNSTQMDYTNGWNQPVSLNRCHKRTIEDAQIERNHISNHEAKQFITEEKVAAQLHNLHLSNDHCYSSNGLPSTSYHSTQQPQQLPETLMNGLMTGKRSAIESINRESTKEKKDKPRKRDWKDLSWEINPAFQDIPKVDVLPKYLLNDIYNKPCLAVIPWKPPEDLVDQICNNINNSNNEDEESGTENIQEEICYTYQIDKDEIVHGYDSYSFSLDDSSCDEIDMDEMTL